MSNPRHEVRAKALKNAGLFEYVRKRYNESLEAAKADDEGCLITQTRRTDGYAQVKLRFDGKQYAPRTYTLANLDQEVPQGLDFSHICGKGDQGCINPLHIVLESHEQNLQRQKCHLKATCSCGEKVYFTECRCIPRCIR